MWRNRIKERTTVKAADLLDHTGNWRTHPEAQKAGMIGVLDEVGIVDALTVYYSEARGGLVIIDGHLRKSIDPDQEWPVDVLDVDDAEADYILATKDPLAMVAVADREKLGALLQDVQSDQAAVQEMLAGLARREKLYLDEDGQEIDPWAEWQGMPEFEDEPLAHRTIYIHFKIAEDVSDFAENIGQNITDKTKSLWYPVHEKRDLKSQGYITNES